jgi:hypothetical protein
VFHSTLAFQGAEGDFARRAGGWSHEPSGSLLNPGEGGFVKATGARPSVKRLEGFDTYWYMWSLTHPDTHVLEPVSR